jgi:hypothetical protein
LKWSWWLLFPSFAALTLRLAVERMCAEPYDLLPALTSKTASAWPLAIVYVLAHVWMISAYLVTVSKTQALLPRPGAIRAVWGAGAARFILMLAAFAIEYAPVPMWRLVGAGFRCAP